MDSAIFDAASRVAEARGLRLLKHPSGRKVGAWKVKDRDGNLVCWPSPPDVVMDWLRTWYELTAEEKTEQLERQLVAAGADPELAP
jgi:hypothetical protein